MEGIDEKTICEFIKAYYSSFSQNASNIFKFYSQNAKIYRQSIPGKIGVSLADAKECLTIDIKKGSDVKVLSYTFANLENSTNVVVNGSIENKEEKKTFTQFFTLAARESVIFIEADTLTVRDLNENIEEINAKLTEARRKGGK